MRSLNHQRKRNILTCNVFNILLTCTVVCSISTLHVCASFFAINYKLFPISTTEDNKKITVFLHDCDHEKVSANMRCQVRGGVHWFN